MSIYDAISDAIAVGEEVKVTCILNGKGVCRALKFPQADYPICVEFEHSLVPIWYTKSGHYSLNDADKGVYPALALGHYDTQLETAQAIKEQNFDVE